MFITCQASCRLNIIKIFILTDHCRLCKPRSFFMCVHTIDRSTDAYVYSHSWSPDVHVVVLWFYIRLVCISLCILLSADYPWISLIKQFCATFVLSVFDKLIVCYRVIWLLSISKCCTIYSSSIRPALHQRLRRCDISNALKKLWTYTASITILSCVKLWVEDVKKLMNEILGKELEIKSKWMTFVDRQQIDTHKTRINDNYLQNDWN